jgi:hypothetical protein
VITIEHLLKSVNMEIYIETVKLVNIPESGDIGTMGGNAWD